MKIISAIILTCLCVSVAKATEERIWFHAKINGQPVLFAFDTGFGANQVLYSTTAKRLGLKITPPDPNQKLDSGGIALGTTELCNVDIGITNGRVAVNVFEIPTYMKPTEDGLMGWPSLSNNIIRMDVAANMVELLTNVPADAAKWTQIPIKANLDILGFEICDKNGKKMTVTVDTGKPEGISLEPQMWREWKTTHTNEPITLDAGYMPGAGLVVKEESWAHKISLGSLMLTDVPIMEANQAETATDIKFEASLGLAALKRLDIVIDGKHGIAYLRSKMTPPLPYWHNRLGAVFVPQDMQSNDLVAHVVEGSPAYEAGIRNNDVLLKIGELDTTKWRTDPNVLPLTRFWNSPARTKLELILKRGDKVFKPTVILRNILPPDAPKNSN